MVYKKRTGKSKPKAAQIESWSFSRYSVYQQCPLKAKLKFIDKITEPTNDAMKRGAAIHNMAEDYIKSRVPAKMPVELKGFDTLFRSMRKRYKKSINGMTVEDTWALTKDWDETTWNDWTHCWLRIKLDLAYTEHKDVMIINDWKTGRYRPNDNDDYIEQLELYVTGGFLLFPHINTIKPRLVYLDHGMIYPEEGTTEYEELIFTRDELPDLIKVWTKRIRPMMNDKSFAPKPNRFCTYCHFRKDNKENGGGQCRF